MVLAPDRWRSGEVRVWNGRMPGFAFFDLDHTLLPFDTQA
jgi:hypothetical protein